MQGQYDERRKEIEGESTPSMKAFYEQGFARAGGPGRFLGAGAAPGGLPGADEWAER